MTLKSPLGEVLFTSTLLIIFCCDSSLADSAENPGMLLYKEGQIEQAKQYFQSQIKASPKDANAHYMLANIFIELKLPVEAKKQYQICAELNPSGAAGQYSKLALSQLKTEADSKFSAITNNIQLSAPLSPNNTGIRQDLKGSVRTISAQTRGDEQRIQKECDAKVAQIYKEADARIQRLEDELKEKIVDNGEATYAYPSFVPWRQLRRGTAPKIKTYDPEPANQELREECDARIAQVKAQASDQADKVMAASKEKASFLEDSALTLDKEYMPAKQTNNVSLVPTGTNMYIRNYELKQSISGNSIPLLAAPPKSLSDTKSSVKVTP